MVVDAGYQLALNERWWIRWRSRPPVREHLLRSHLRCWLPVVTGALKRNADSGQEPKTWTALSQLLLCDNTTLWRWRDARVTLESQDFLALAGLMDVPVDSLFPTPSQWLATATRSLCHGDVEKHEAFSYAVYRLTSPHRYATRLNEEAVRRVLKETRKWHDTMREVEDSIVRTARRLGQALLPLIDLE